MKKLFMIFAVAMLALGGCGEHQKETAGKQTIKIGATFPLSGDGAEAGTVTRKALEMVLEDLEKQDLKYNYELVFEDNQMSPQKTAITTNKLIHSDKVRAVLSFWGVMSNVAATQANQNNVISMSCAFGSNPSKGKYAFNFMPTFESQAKLLVEELKKREVKTIAAFVDNSDMLAQWEAIEKEIKENSDIKIIFAGASEKDIEAAKKDPRVKVVFAEQFNIGEKNYKMAIAKAAVFNPDMYYISGYNPSVYLFLKQLKEITGRNDNVTSIDVFTEISPQNIKIADGLWFVDSHLMGKKAFQQEFKERAGLVSQSCTGNTVANLQILVEAFEKSSTLPQIPDNDMVKAYIMNEISGKETVSGEITVLKNKMITVEPEIGIINAADWVI